LTVSPTAGSTNTYGGVIAGGGTLGTIGLLFNGTGLQNLAGSNTWDESLVYVM
jgi:hypothetical protein